MSTMMGVIFNILMIIFAGDYVGGDGEFAEDSPVYDTAYEIAYCVTKSIDLPCEPVTR